MKLVVHYLNKVEIAADLQSFVSLAFFILFVFILYVVLKGNKREYESYGDFPMEDGTITNDLDSQNKTQ